MSDQSRRKLLKSIAAGSSAVIASKSLPENWTKPVVNSVMLPVHAQTSQAEESTTQAVVYTQTQGYDLAVNSVTTIPTQNFVFDLGGVIPTGDGTVTISNLAGDIDSNIIEQWTVQVGGVTVGLTNNGTQCGPAIPSQVFDVTLAQLQAAISGGSITVTTLNGGGINTFCTTNTMDVTLSFPGEV